jgi:hypothetical protein
MKCLRRDLSVFLSICHQLLEDQEHRAEAWDRIGVGQGQGFEFRIWIPKSNCLGSNPNFACCVTLKFPPRFPCVLSWGVGKVMNEWKLRTVTGTEWVLNMIYYEPHEDLLCSSTNSATPNEWLTIQFWCYPELEQIQSKGKVLCFCHYLNLASHPTNQKTRFPIKFPYFKLYLNILSSGHLHFSLP